MELVRFDLPQDTKPPSDLMAELHESHQVPIGCGGAVFRWRRRSDGFRMTLYQHCFCRSRLILDGVEPPTTLLMFSFDRHALCFELEASSDSLVGFVVAAEEADVVRPHNWMFLEDFVPPPTYRVLSKPDGKWKFTRTRPANDDWLRPGFDDSQWDTLVAAPGIELGSVGRQHRWLARRALELGGCYLTTPPDDGSHPPTTAPPGQHDTPFRESPSADRSAEVRLWVRHEFVTGPEAELKLP